MDQWIANNWKLITIVGFVYIQIVNALPMPKDTQVVYKVVFTVLHGITNWSRIVALYQGKAV